MNSNPTRKLVAEAREIARRVDSWISLSNALSGLIVRYFPNPDQREEFLRSAEYEELNQLLLRMIEKKGLYPRAANGRNGAT